MLNWCSSHAMEVERLVRKMLLKLSSTSLPITLNPMCQPLDSEGGCGSRMSFHVCGKQHAVAWPVTDSKAIH